jgi:hypothetical protein
VIGSRVRVSARNCNLQIRDPKNTFDSSVLVRGYHLHLDNPFERAIMILLTHLIPSHQTYIVANSEYYDPDKRSWVNLELKEAVDTEYYKKRPLGQEQLKVIDGLKRILLATEDVGKAIELFQMVDEDGSGELDEEEFAKLIDAVGMDGSKSGEILAEYDVDGGGVIEITEFLLFLKTQRKEATKRLQELTEYPILYSALEYPDENSIKVRYLPPKRGEIKITIVDGFTQKATYRVISPEDRTNILKVAEDSGDLLTMTSFGVKNYKIRLYEAISLAHSLMKDSDKVQVLSTVLPQMAQSQEARLLVNKIIDYNITDLTRLKRAIGQFYRVIMGRPDGYYCLDLSNEMDRCCVNRLLEISMTTQYFRSKKRDILGYGKLGDTSQHNNYSCFRNELLSRKPVEVDTDFASPLPRVGKLEFDFVSQRHFSTDNGIINDVRFTNLLLKTFQLRKQDRTKVLKALHQMKKTCNWTIQGNAKRIYEIPKEKAIEIGFLMDDFYNHLSERTEQNEKYRQKENIKIAWEFDANKIRLRQGNFHKIYNIPNFPTEKFDLLMKNPQHHHNHHNNNKKAMRKSASTLAVAAAPSTDQQAEDDSFEDPDDEEDDDNDDDDSSFGVQSESDDEPELEGSDLEIVDTEEMKDRELEKAFLAGLPAKKASIEEAVLSIVQQQSNTLSPTSAIPTPLEGSMPSSPHRSLGKTIQSSIVHSPTQSAVPLKPPSRPRTTKKGSKQSFIPETLNRYLCLMASRNIPQPTKAAKTLELLIDTFETVFMTMRQMEILVILFEPLGTMKTSDHFGTYRVELIIALFGNVVDIWNIEILYRHLSSFEMACLYARLGMLNLFNPMKPEGGFSFNLSRHEERQCVKMLAHLAVVEPGKKETHLLLFLFLSFHSSHSLSSVCPSR